MLGWCLGTEVLDGTVRWCVMGFCVRLGDLWGCWVWVILADEDFIQVPNFGGVQM